MWIESMNSLKSSVTQIQSQMDKTRFYVKTGMTPASQLASSTSCALVWMKWSWLGIWGKGVRPDTDYDLAKQLNSETVKK